MISSTIVVALQLVAALAAATLLAIWSGWGLARLFLPTPLVAYRHLLTPLIGYTFVLVIGYWHVRTITGLLPALIVVALLGGVSNLIAWKRFGPPKLGLALRTEWPILTLFVITLLVGIAPLLHYGSPAIIGAGWDTENYLPMARYLERGQVAAIATAPSNPLRELNTSPPRIGLTLGFSIWQGSVDLLSQQEALLTFAPLLAWLRSLGVVAVYVLLQALLGLQRGPALLGAALTSAGSLLLWVSYFNFGMQLAAWPLIPLVLCLVIATLEDQLQPDSRSQRGIVLAALGLAAVPIAYYPALTLLVPLLIALSVPMLWQTRYSPQKVLTPGLLMIGLAACLAAPTFVDYTQGFSYRYANQLTSLGIFSFIPSSDIVGLTPFSRPAASMPLPQLMPFGWVLLVPLVAAGVLGGKQRIRLLGLVAGGIVYLAWLRLWQNYPYAYMKGAAYTGWIIAACIACGWQYILALQSRIVRTAGTLASLSLLAMLACNQSAVVMAHWQEPGLYSQQLPALIDIRRLIPAGSTVRLSSDPRIQGVTSGLAAYLLDHTTVIGSSRTGYTSGSAGVPGDYAEYALLAEFEDASAWGYVTPTWRGGGFALYQRPVETLNHQRLDTMLLPNEQYELLIGTTQTSQMTQDADQLRLNVASFAATSITIDGQHFQLPVGGSQLLLAPSHTPTIITNSGNSPLLLQHAMLTADITPAAEIVPISAPKGQASVIPQRSTALIQASATAEGTRITTTVQAFLNGCGPVVVALDIWDAQNHYGWYGVILQNHQAAQQISMQIDVETGIASATSAGQAEIPLGASFAGLRPGTYLAQLKLGSNSISLIEPTELFSFQIDQAGNISEIWTTTTPILAAELNRPITQINAQLGEDTSLEGYWFPTKQLHPGDTFEWVVWWRALRDIRDDRSVFVHVLNERGDMITQYDGPPTAGMKPTPTWRTDDIVLDMRQITLPLALPVGKYRLLVGMYRWPSLERLPLTIAGLRQEQEAVVIPFEVRQK